MAHKIAYSGAGCPTIGYDGVPCTGQMDWQGIVEIHNNITTDYNSYYCDVCTTNVLIERNAHDRVNED